MHQRVRRPGKRVEVPLPVLQKRRRYVIICTLNGNLCQIREISVSHSDENEDDCLLGFYVSCVISHIVFPVYFHVLAFAVCPPPVSQRLPCSVCPHTNLPPPP
jgi:hypothetical protein